MRSSRLSRRWSNKSPAAMDSRSSKFESRKPPRRTGRPSAMPPAHGKAQRIAREGPARCTGRPSENGANSAQVSVILAYNFLNKT